MVSSLTLLYYAWAACFLRMGLWPNPFDSQTRLNTICSSLTIKPLRFSLSASFIKSGTRSSGSWRVPANEASSDWNVLCRCRKQTDRENCTLKQYWLEHASILVKLGKSTNLQTFRPMAFLFE